MSLELEEKLKLYRWFPGRRVEDARVDEWLRIGVNDFGCHIFPEAVRVLREFGDLLIGSTHISPEENVGRGDPETWLLWEWQINEILFPIACDLGDLPWTFALASNGKVYGRGTGDLYCGDTFEEFLGNICLGRQRRNWYEFLHPSWTDEGYEEIERLNAAVFRRGK